ncbi:MAG TPA: hypothetical protein PK431_14380 [Chitinophagales bacterium]|nr:hypothetical protein [Chitinophagales bacterium]
MAKNKAKAVTQQQNIQATKTPTKKAVSASNKPKSFYFILAAFAVVLVTLLVFIPSFSLHFVNWDDPYNLLENENLKAFATHWSWQSVKQIFSSHVIGNYNPLPIFTFALEKYFFANNPLSNPFIFHFNNVVLHLMCTFLVFFIFTKLEMSRTAAIIGTLLFGIHPMRVESVAWITERKDVLYGLFFLASTACYILYLQKPTSKTKWFLLTIVLSLFAYFSKVQAVTLPLTMVALDFYFKRKWLSPKILIIEKLPWWILSLAFGLLNIYFLKQENSLNSSNAVVNYNFLDKLAVGAYSYAVYIIKWIYPYKMSPLYPYSPEVPILAYVCLAVVPVFIIGLLVWSFKNKKNNLIFGWAFFTFNVIFLLQIVGAGQGFLADRFTYIAYIGLFFLTAKFYDLLKEQKPASSLFLQIGFGIYLVFFCYLTQQQIKIWQNGGTLWEQVKTYYPNSPLVWKNLANYYRDEEKNRDKAIENYTQAILLEPKNAYTYNDLAKAYMDKAFSLDATANEQRNSLLTSAMQNYNIAITKDSINQQPDKKTSGEILVNRGVAYAVAGNTQQAVIDLTKGLELNPTNLNGYLNRGLLYYNTNQFELSLKDRDAYINLNPDNPDIYYERGICKINLEKNTEAIPDFDKAIMLNPSVGIYYYGRATAYKKLGNTTSSKSDAQKAKQLGIAVPNDLLN